MRKVLIVEDEFDFAQVVALNLRRGGFETVVARAGEPAIVEARRHRPDLVILDLMLPDIPGTEVCRRLKAEPGTRSIPIIMLTARSEEVDRVVGFELGADDYVVKPVSMRELVLRANAVLRRGTPDEDGAAVVEAGGLRIDGPAHRATLDGATLPLTALEFRVLAALASRRGRVMSREALLDAVWGAANEVEARTVDAVVKRLRDKLGRADRLIETVRGVGYRFGEAP